jgi:hypothetical protein
VRRALIFEVVRPPHRERPRVGLCRACVSFSQRSDCTCGSHRRTCRPTGGLAADYASGRTGTQDHAHAPRAPPGVKPTTQWGPTPPDWPPFAPLANPWLMRLEKLRTENGLRPWTVPFKSLTTFSFWLVRTAGVEPARGLPLRILSPVCLPVPPRPRGRDRQEATVPEIITPGNAIHGRSIGARARLGGERSASLMRIRAGRSANRAMARQTGSAAWT